MAALQRLIATEDFSKLQDTMGIVVSKAIVELDTDPTEASGRLS